MGESLGKAETSEGENYNEGSSDVEEGAGAVGKTESLVKQFLFLHAKQLLQEQDSTTKAEVTRYLLQNGAYDGLRAQRHASDNTWRFFGYDLQGNTKLLINSDGSSNLSLLYRAFGQKQASSGAGQTLMQFGSMWGYEWDADSRMWVKARHLSGTQGRWL